MIQLTEVEARILGSLIEKALTTPEYYPLSLNALTNACNQKSNRDPMMSIDEATVARALGTLKEKRLVQQKNDPGSRVARFAHRMENLFLGSPQEVGTLCVLLLRGPQTLGEIKGRTDRLCSFADISEVITVLDGLASRPEGAMVTRVARQTGQKEARYQHLLCGALAQKDVLTEPSALKAPPVRTKSEGFPSDNRMNLLEKRVAELEALVRELQTPKSVG